MATSVVKAPIFKNNRTTLERVEKFVSDVYFTDCNLRGRLYGDRVPFKKLTRINCDQERIPFADAVKKLEKDGEEVMSGLSIGPSWSTHWFKAEIEIPTAWNGQTVHLRWDTDGEALIWSKDGQPLKGMAGEYGKTDFQLPSSTKGPIEFYIEVACNTCFGCGKDGMINPPDPDRQFTIKTAEIAVFREDVFQLLIDFDILIGMAKHLPEKSSLRYDAMFLANDLVNHCSPTTSESIAQCHKRATEFFNHLASAKPEHSDGFTIHAVGNAHIDTAWLWRYDETKRKCARTFSTVLHLMEKYPNSARFAVSQAQQLEWIHQNYPQLFDRLKAKAKEGKIVGVGGCWVEMDGNIPSGESLVRQMLYGQRFFEQYFGHRCTEYWLPDTFGYPSQLPQLMVAAGMQRFVTQKMSWNLVNRFPNQTFWWQGLDGTKVLTHFPPADTYCSRVTIEEAVKIDQDFADKGRSHSALLLYGYGDGGGGPDEKMLERLERMKALPGLPQVTPSTPNEFFAGVERTDLQNLVTWSGELYLELHNGTYTTHSEVKAKNRFSEFLLRECEFVSAMLWASKSQKTYKNFEREWKNVLLNQFHDVLPGTSIGSVYEDANKLYENTKVACELYLLNGDEQKDSGKPREKCLLNTLPWPRIVEYAGKVVKLPPMSIINVTDASVNITTDEENGAEVIASGDFFILRNTLISAKIHKRSGQLVSLTMVDADDNPNVEAFYDGIRPGERGNRFMLYDDVPLYWDAWDVMDYHLETGKPCEELEKEVTIVESKPTRCALEFVVKIGAKSQLTQKIIVRPDQPYLEFESKIEWQEQHKLLKVEFPINVHSGEATYEIQFGHVKRPAHRNTSWDSAKFEVCAHKWADVSESGFGVALLNDCKYGHSCHDGVLSLSIIRGPTAPDANADFKSQHQFTYAVMPHRGPVYSQQAGQLNVIQAAYNLNSPAYPVFLSPATATSICGRSWFEIDNPAIMIEALKVAEDEKSLILRIYECHGGKAMGKLSTLFQVKDAYKCNLLEERIEGEKPLKIVPGKNVRAIELFLKAFEVQTLSLVLG